MRCDVIPEMDSIVLKEKRESHAPLVLVDIRESFERELGYIKSSVHVAQDTLASQASKIIPNKEHCVVCYCAGGFRSKQAVSALKKIGYSNVWSLRGGFQEWQKFGFEAFYPSSLDEDVRKRYQRQIVLPEVGVAGQKKLLEAKVLLVGVGGLGSAIGAYLAAAGIGTLGIVDGDMVEESNLHRQILHHEDQLGKPKIQSALASIKAINSKTKVIPYYEHLEKNSAYQIMKDYQIVVDGSDNYAARFAINDTCTVLQIPCVYGSVYRFEGQVSVFDTKNGGPCYRCLVPEAPPADQSPSCAQAGVLGVLPGIIGMLQAVETIKIVLGKGDLLRGRLLCYQALEARFKEFAFKKNKYCVCGTLRP